MPISSGAGGKAARLHLNNSNGNNKSSRFQWPNDSANTTAAAIKSRSTSALQSIVNDRPSAGSPSAPSSSSSGSSSTTNLNLNLNRATGPSKLKIGASSSQSSLNSIRVFPIKVKASRSEMSNKNQQRTATVEKYRQIRHISPPSSHQATTTSPTAFKYFSSQQDENTIHNSDQRDTEQSTTNEILTFGKQQQQRVKKSKAAKGKPNKMLSSLGGQLIVTGGQERPGATATPTLTPKNHANEPADKARPEREKTTTRQNSQQPQPGKSMGLFSSLMTLGGANYKHQPQQNQHYKAAQQLQPPASASTTINHHNSQTSLNPSLSFMASGGGRSGGAANSDSSAANLHSLSSLHGMQSRSTQGLTTTTTINKRINLKYVKTLIILLMSLDLMVTLFVHHFASHDDEFSLIYTQHKLRFSLVNLVLSAIWFIVLAGAILFDVYAILLIGALVDIASFVLLLVCSVIHFAHRIDYNTVNLTSLLLLLFSIIVLHVYLLVMAALTIYLMSAVKRRRKH